MDTHIFAEVSPYAWVAPVVAAVVGGVTTIVAGYFALVTHRTKLQFDADREKDRAARRGLAKKVARGSKKIATLEAKVEACEKDRAELQATCDRQQREIDSLKRAQVAAGQRADSAEVPTPPR
jgi:predicted RNase H-like nuclease (RuvC/YqgF family)